MSVGHAAELVLIAVGVATVGGCLFGKDSRWSGIWVHLHTDSTPPPPSAGKVKSSAQPPPESKEEEENSEAAAAAVDECAVRRQRWEDSIANAQQRELDLIVEARDFFTAGSSGDDRHARPPLVSAAAAAAASATSAAVHLDAALERRIQTFGLPSPRAPLSIAAEHQPLPSHRDGTQHRRVAGPWSWCSAALRRFAFGCAMHRRLGHASPVHLLPPEIVREICDHVPTRQMVVVCGGIGYEEQEELALTDAARSSTARSSEAIALRPKRTWPWEEHEESDLSMARHHDDTTFDAEHSPSVPAAGANTAPSPQPSFEALRSTEVLELPRSVTAGEGHSCWEGADEMAVGRSAPAVCKLPSGEILAVGGYCLKTREVLSSVEIFNPATGVWCSNMVPPLPTPRAGALAIVLPPVVGLQFRARHQSQDQGQTERETGELMCSVLLCGGVGEGVEQCLATTCILRIPTAAAASSWKKARWEWEERSPMLTARTDHCGVLLPPPPPRSPLVTRSVHTAAVGAADLYVVVMGGFAGALDQRKGQTFHTARYGGPCRSVELYCVGDDAWYTMPEMLEARQGGGAVLLPLPRVLPMLPDGLTRRQHAERERDQATEGSRYVTEPVESSLELIEGGHPEQTVTEPQYWVCVGGGRGIGPVIGGGRGGCLRTVEAVSVSALLRNGRDAHAAVVARDEDEIEGWMRLRQEQQRSEQDPELEREMMMTMEAEEELLESDAGVQQLLVRAGVLPFVSLVWRPLPNMLRGRRDCQMLWTGAHFEPWSAWIKSDSGTDDLSEGGSLLLLGGQDGGGALLGSVEALHPSSVHGWRASWGPFPPLNSPRREFGAVALRL